MTNLLNAEHLQLIARIEDKTGASVRMWAGVHSAPIEWASVLGTRRHVGRTCCASTVGDVHDRTCETAEAHQEWLPRSLRH